MKHKAIYYKQLTNGNVAHVYEHMVSHAVTREFLKRELYRNFDYEFYATTRDGIVRLGVYTNDKKILKLFYNTIKSHKSSEQDIKDCISQIEVEYKFKAICDMPKVRQMISDAEKKPWQDHVNMGITDFPKQLARNYKTKEISLTKTPKNMFETYELRYEIGACETNLRPLVPYVLYSLGITVLDVVGVKLSQTYDDGDKWAEYQKPMGYLNYVSFHKTNNYKKADFLKIQKDILSKFKSDKVSSKIASAATDDFTTENSLITNNENYAMSGHYIGEKLFKKYATKENVKIILDSIDLVAKKTL